MEENMLSYREKQIIKLNNLNINIINWYDFINFDSILIIGKLNKDLLQYCLNKFKKVSVIDRDISKEILVNCPNLNVFSSLDVINEKFNYIIFIKAFYFQTVNDRSSKVLNFMSEKLKDNGKILVIENNQKGAFQLVQGKYEGFTKERLESIIYNTDFKYYKFYYVLPRIEQVNVVFSDKYLPTLNDLRRNVLFSLQKNNYINQENEIFFNCLNNEKNSFKECTNCYIIELSKNDNLSKINAVFFNNIRPEKYRLMTLLYDIYAIKKNVDLNSVEHLNYIKKNIKLIKSLNLNILDNEESDYIKSTILSRGERFDDLIKQKILNGSMDNVLEQINDFKTKVYLKLQKVEDKNIFKKYDIFISDEKNSKLTYVKHGFWDLAYQNVFKENNEYYLYDQEWYEENLPIEFMEFRSIEMINGISQEKREEIYIKEGIIDYISEFRLLEKALQKELTNSEMLDLYFNSLYKENDD